MSTSAVRAVLLAYGSLYSLVGDRIYRDRLPDNPVYPCISYNATEEPENLINGVSTLSHYIYEFYVYDVDFSSLEAVSAQLKAAMASSSFDSVLSDSKDGEYLSDTRIYSIFLEFSVWI